MYKFDMPTKRALKLLNEHENKDNWKMPPTPYHTEDQELAIEYGYALDFYHGGHETTSKDGVYTVTTKGYYHYVGA